MLSLAITGVMLAFFTAIQVWINKGRFDALERRIDHHDRRFDRLSAEIASLRSDITQIALAVGGRTGTQTG